MEKRGKSKKALTLLIVSILIFIISFIFDKQIFSLIQSLRNPICDTFFSWILFLEEKFIYYPLVLIASFGVIFWRKRKSILPFVFTFFISLLIILFLKFIIYRPRPLFPELKESFPAGHTLVFTVLPFLDYKKNKYIKVIWLIIACLFMLVRIWFGLHYLSDIIAGLIIINTFAFIIKNSWKKLKTSKTKSKKKAKKKKRK